MEGKSEGKLPRSDLGCKGTTSKKHRKNLGFFDTFAKPPSKKTNKNRRKIDEKAFQKMFQKTTSLLIGF